MMLRELVIVGLVLVIQYAHTQGTCPLRGTTTFTEPSNVCLAVNLCPNQKITFTGTRCPKDTRITIWFYLAQEPRANPQFDARFGYGGRYKYQANNYGVNGWGAEQKFSKTMDLVAGQAFDMDFLIHGDTTIEWKIDGAPIGTYELRENGRVSDIKKICLVRCATIDMVKFSVV